MKQHYTMTHKTYRSAADCSGLVKHTACEKTECLLYDISGSTCFLSFCIISNDNADNEVEYNFSTVFCRESKQSSASFDCKPGESAKKNDMLKGRVHCFSIQVVMNKCFLLNLEKIWCRLVLSFSR